MKPLLLLSLFAIIGSLRAAESWWEVRIAGQSTGYQHTVVDTLTDGSIRTTEETLIALNRLGKRVEMRTRTETIESTAGEMISVREETQSAQQTVIAEARRQGDAIEVTTTAGGKSYPRSVPVRGPLWGPAALARQTQAQLLSPGDVVACTMFQTGLNVFIAKRTLVGTETRESLPLLRVKSEIEGVPGAAEELLRADGTVFESKRDMPFGLMVASAADRTRALQASAGGELPAEAYGRTLARSNIRFADPRSVERVRLKLTHRQPALGWPALRGPYQRIIEQTPAAVVLEWDTARASVTGAAIDLRDCLVPNQILQSDDAEVVRLTREVIGQEKNPARAVRLLQDWVAQHMKFDAGVALTPASEVVRNRRGTCLASAVLLASMARAAEIPARIAMGYIYVSGAWGGHAWAEVYVDGAWRAIDAAAYRAGYADAARFQFDSYTFADGGAGSTSAGQQLYGQIDVAILEYSIGGTHYSVPENARGHTVTSDIYENPWLGFRLHKPTDMTFTALDAIYPDSTVLALENSSASGKVTLLGTGVDADRRMRELLNEVGAPDLARPLPLDGQPALIVSTAGKARLISRRGEAFWMLTTQGADALRLLETLVHEWKWITPGR